ncbi:MAG: HRDC domain-containing protein [Gemmatimonadaceae bacterium]|nr:HRDC domain-containing protein [Gemmatimonadaceae bacterium]
MTVPNDPKTVPAAPARVRHDALYVDTPAAAERLMGSIGRVDRIAIDTEGASFHRFVDRIYLIQISTRDVTAVIDPLTAGDLPGLGAVLADRGIEVVLHDADYDLRLLHQDYGWHPTNIFDTRVAAQLLGIPAFGLGALLERYLGIKLEKKHQRADWSMRPLPQGMLEYAQEDTRYLLELRDLIGTDLERLGRMDWAREEFELLEGTRWAAEDESLAFMRIKGARDLTRRELAVLGELAHWRDATAAELDRAVFRVMANEVLLELARTAPTREDQLLGIKGMPRSLAQRASREILAAVSRGMALPEDKLPRYPKAPRWQKDPDFDRRATLIKGARDTAAKRLQLDPGVLCSRERLEAVARRNPASMEELAEVRELRKWQAKELGPDFLRALQP